MRTNSPDADGAVKSKCPAVVEIYSGKPSTAPEPGVFSISVEGILINPLVTKPLD